MPSINPKLKVVAVVVDVAAHVAWLLMLLLMSLNPMLEVVVVDVVAHVALLLMLVLMSRLAGHRGLTTVRLTRRSLDEQIKRKVLVVPGFCLLVIEGIFGFIIPPDCSSVPFCAKYMWYIHKAILILTALLICPVRSFAIKYVHKLHDDTYSGKQDAVPFTNRIRFITSFSEAELQSGALEFEEKKKEHGDKVLPESDEESERVIGITTKIVEAAVAIMPETHAFFKGWEVIVIKDDEKVGAKCWPGCKIEVYTGLLKNFKGEAELATVLSHEVSHAITRHAVEDCIRSYLELGILRLYERLAYFIMIPRLVSAFVINNLHKYCFSLPSSRGTEIEADHIGLFLLAIAGYDPSVAPLVWKKLGDISGDPSKYSDYKSTHPSFKKREQFVSQDHVMKVALNLYSEIKCQEMLFSLYCGRFGKPETR